MPIGNEFFTDVVEVDVATGERIERDFTEEESAQREIDATAEAGTKVEAEKTAQRLIKAKDLAVAHAKSLGFTDEMIAVMYPNLVEE